MTTVIILLISTTVIASVASLTMNYSSNFRRSRNRDQAFYMADAGIRCATPRLKEKDIRTISLTESRTFLSNTNSINKGNWGFNTYIENVTGKTNRLVSIGYYGGSKQRIEQLFFDSSTHTNVSEALKVAIYEGNDGHTLHLDSNDFINGPVHVQGNLDAHGARLDRSEKDLGDVEGSTAQDARVYEHENWIEAGNPTVFDHPATQSEYDEQKRFADNNKDILKTDGLYNPGEAFLDKGNGSLDSGEKVFNTASEKNNYASSHPNDTIVTVGTGENTHWFVDKGNGVYDDGELFVDDRNGVYDRGVTAQGSIQNIEGTTADGELPPVGGDEEIAPPVLANMYYNLPKDSLAPGGALEGWGHDIKINRETFGATSVGTVALKIAESHKDDPEHIFIMNPPRTYYENGASVPNENSSKNGILKRKYQALEYPRTKNDDGTYKWGDKAGTRIIDDFFLEDRFHPSYGNRDNNYAITTTQRHKTAPEFIDVKENGNNKVYYVDGNLWIHSITAYAMRFSEPGTKITIVARGNITISDEFYYNGTYGNVTTDGDHSTTANNASVSYEEMSSTAITNPQDNLCLIALKNRDVDNALGDGSSGNIYIGDPAVGTGGSIHSMLYAENDFIDNNLNTANQPFISVFGCMAAGNNIDITRTANNPTRLDVTLDTRAEELPGLPPSLTSQENAIQHKPVWGALPNTWKTASNTP